MATNTQSHCGCKVGRKAAAFELENLDEALRRRREEDEASLRELAAFVNKRIIDVAVERADADILVDSETVYEVFTADDVDPEREVRIRNLLADVGVDAVQLDNEFVSYQVIRTHLQDCLDMETDRQGISTIDEGRKSISHSRKRSRTVIERTLQRLQRVDTLHDTDISVSLSTRVYCNECDTVYTVDEYLEQQGCTCSSQE